VFNLLNEEVMLLEILRAVAAKNESGRRVHILLSGGSSIESVLIELRNKIDPKNVSLYLADERMVPISSLESNTGMVQRVMGDKYDVVDFYEKGFPSLEKGKLLLSKVPFFDFAVLGVGEDGHICSLFPDMDSFLPSELLVEINDSPKPPLERLTVTYELLGRCKRGFLLVKGEKKRHLLSWLDEESRQDLPYQKVVKLLNFSICSHYTKES